MTSAPLCAIVLAAGKGTRMRSDRPKVMHALAGFPMLWHVLRTVRAASIAEVTVVTAPGMDDVRTLAQAVFPGCGIAVQEEQLGTGHAARMAQGRISETGDHLILFGDTPLIRAETIQRLLEELKHSDVAVLGMRPADPARYGRLLLGADGSVDGIVEWKDASEAQRAIPWCNSGVMAVGQSRLFALLEEIGNVNASGEYYLTDLIGIARKRGLVCRMVEAEAAELQGVNSRAELAAAEAAIQQRLRAAAMEGGVTLIDPASFHLAADTVLGRDVTIEPQVVFGPGVTIGDGVRIRAFSHLEGASVATGAVVGPYARLRPGARIEAGAHVGNFVEIKNATLGAGAKANHLSYLGDATIGAGSNIGAGTITCNYDGFAKHRTEIGRDVFIGSNSALVAPLSVGDGAIIGAGSTITRDVPADALALTRAEMTLREGGGAVFREMRKPKGNT